MTLGKHKKLMHNLNGRVVQVLNKKGNFRGLMFYQGGEGRGKPLIVNLDTVWELLSLAYGHFSFLILVSKYNVRLIPHSNQNAM